ncbi:MAG: pilus assembly protein PilM [Opitutaceae bacterium]
MPRFSKSSRSSGTAVVEIGVSHVAAARFGSGAKGLNLKAFAFRELPMGEDATGIATSAERAIALGEVVTQLGRLESATLVISGHLALTKTIKVPAAVAAQREKLIAFEVKQSIPFPLKEVFWSHQVGVEHQGELEVLVVAAKLDGVRELVEQAQAVGMTIDRVIPAGVALDGLPRLATEGELVVSIGARSTHLLFRTVTTRHLRTLSLAGQTVTRGIAQKLEQTLTEAEQLKRGVFSGAVDLPAETPAGEAVQNGADSFAARLQLEINRSLVAQVRQAGGTAPDTLLLTGGGSLMPGLVEHLSGKWTGGTVSRLDPWVGVAVGADLEAAVDAVGPQRLADLVGAALSAAEGGINLAPPELGAARAAKRRRPRWAIAAVLLIGALSLPGIHYQRLTSARQAAAVDLSRRMAPVQALQDQNQRNIAELDHLQEEIRELGDRVKARDAWTGLLADLQNSLVAVGDVWLERLQVLPPVVQRAPSTGPVYDDDGVLQKLPAIPLRLRLSGRLLDRENPLSRVSQASYERVTVLLNKFVESPRILEVEGERFDASEPGLLRFDFTLVINPTTHL